MNQLDKGVLSIQILCSVGDVISCEQDLGDGLPSVHKQLVPQTHELALSDSSQSLDLWEMFRSSVHHHVAESDANGARGDNDDAMSIFL